MSKPSLAHLAEYRALRDQAWAVVRSDIDALQADLTATGIGERIKDRAAEEAEAAWDSARRASEGLLIGRPLAAWKRGRRATGECRFAQATRRRWPRTEARLSPPQSPNPARSAEPV